MARCPRSVSYQPLPYHPFVPDDPSAALSAFIGRLNQRRSVRQFSDRSVPRAMIEDLIRAACSAPSGANRQPWRFVAVGDPDLKRAIRLGAEEEERAFYKHRASAQWLADLADLGTDADKGYLEVVPWVIAVFRRVQEEEGGRVYYSHESVGIACGMLLAAAQEAGLATLTHTPSPMRFLNRILARPRNEKPFLLIPVGWPAADAVVPSAATKRRPLSESLLFRT
jgi:nitroreductase